MMAECLRLQADGTLNRASRGYLSHIESAASSARHLVDSFLDFSVIESGRLKIERSLTDIRVVVRRAKALLKIPAKKKHVAITCSMPRTSRLRR